MKCLVTGSEGFIGKNLVARLESLGHEVDGYDIKVGKDLQALESLVKPQFDVIYHLACVNQMQAITNMSANLVVNALSAKRMAQLAEYCGAKLIYTSTASVYGNPDVIPTPVTAETRPLTDYAIAKLAGEHFVRNSGCDYTILRLSNVYGPHQTPENPYCGVIGRFISQALAGEPLTIIGDGQQTRDFTYVDDVVDAITRCGFAVDFPSFVLNVSTGIETSIEDVALQVLYNYEGCFRLKRNVAERPVDSVQRRALKPTFLGTITFKEGIKRTVEWCREQS